MVARAMEKHFQQLSDGGLGSTTDLQRAKLARVTAEVQILRLKSSSSFPDWKL